LRKDIKPLGGEASWWLALIFSRFAHAAGAGEDVPGDGMGRWRR